MIKEFSAQGGPASGWEVLEKKLGVKFRNKDLLRQAFIHRSYLNENPSDNRIENLQILTNRQNVSKSVILKKRADKYQNRARYSRGLSSLRSDAPQYISDKVLLDRDLFERIKEYL